MSSANFSALLVILFSKSLMYIKNNKGPNTNPCGTQLKIDFQFETSIFYNILSSVSQSLFYPVDYAVIMLDTTGF